MYSSINQPFPHASTHPSIHLPVQPSTLPPCVCPFILFYSVNILGTHRPPCPVVWFAGVIPTKFSASLISSPKSRKYWENATILKRLGTPEDVANLVVFLISDEASYITAETVPITGGLLAARLWATTCGCQSAQHWYCCFESYLLGEAVVYTLLSISA